MIFNLRINSYIWITDEEFFFVKFYQMPIEYKILTLKKRRKKAKIDCFHSAPFSY